MKRCIQFLGLGRATFFMVRVGFRACSFGTGRAQVTGNWLISGHNISNSGNFQATFKLHLGHIWATIMYE